MAFSTLSNRAKPVVFNGGSLIVFNSILEQKAKVPSEPIIK